MPELVWEYRLPESILALRHWRTLRLWTARLLNRGVIGQIKKLKRNFDKFQSCGEIESMHEFEVYIAFARKIGGAAGLNRIVKAR